MLEFLIDKIMAYLFILEVELKVEFGIAFFSLSLLTAFIFRIPSDTCHYQEARSSHFKFRCIDGVEWKVITILLLNKLLYSLFFNKSECLNYCFMENYFSMSEGNKTITTKEIHSLMNFVFFFWGNIFID